MQKSGQVTLTLLLLLTLVIIPALTLAAPPPLSAETAILMDLKTGTVLHEVLADQVMFPASTTKIMTALLALELGDLDELVTVGIEVMMLPHSSSKAGLMVGDQISLRELLYGLMLPSGNDAAYSIAVHLARIASDDPDLSATRGLSLYSELMTDRARRLGATSTNFANPDGFHHPEHYSTARDMALIAQAAMEEPLFRQLAATGHYVTETWIGPHVRPWGNLNHLIRPSFANYYEKATGLKTGYTRRAGFTLVASASDGDMELVSVIMKSGKDGRWLDSVALLEYGFENYVYTQVVTEGELVLTVPITNQDPNAPTEVSLLAASSFAGTFSVQDSARIRTEISFHSDLLAADDRLRAPLSREQSVGELVVLLDNQELFRTPLLAGEDVLPYPLWRKLIVPGTLTALVAAMVAVAFSFQNKKVTRNIGRRF